MSSLDHEQLLLEIFNDALLEELLLSENATNEEREFVIKNINLTKNVWDTKPLIAVFRALHTNTK